MIERSQPIPLRFWREVRSTLRSRREARVLFGFYEDTLIALHAFIKKTQKTAPEDLAMERQRLKEMSS